MLAVTVHGATNLWRSPTKPITSPRLNIVAFCPCVVKIASGVKPKEKGNPLWEHTWDIPFYTASRIRFEIGHKAFISTDYVAYAEVELCNNASGKTSLPLSYMFRSENGPSFLDVEINYRDTPVATPERPLAISNKGVDVNYLFIYLTYEPAISDPLEALPVTFKLPVLVSSDENFCVYDQKNDWNRIGYSGCGSGFVGPTGITHVGCIRASAADMKFWIEIVSTTYEGAATVHIANVKARRTNAWIEFKPDDCFHLFESTVAVSPGCAQALPVAFSIKSKTLRAENFEGRLPQDPSTFDLELFELVRESSQFLRQIVSRHTPTPFGLMCSNNGCVAPTRLAVSLGLQSLKAPDIGKDRPYGLYRIMGLKADDSVEFQAKFWGIMYRAKAKNKEIEVLSANKYQIGGIHFFTTPKYDDMMCSVIDFENVSPDVRVILFGGDLQQKPFASLNGCGAPYPVELSTQLNLHDYVRFIDPDSGKEIGIYQHQRSVFDRVYACFGGLVRTSEGWTWVPISRSYGETEAKSLKKAMRSAWEKVRPDWVH